MASEQDEGDSTIRTNIELFKEVYDNEFNKLKREMEDTEKEDLYSLRQIARSHVDDLLQGKGSVPPRSARGMALPLNEKEQWKRHFVMNDTKEEYLNSRGTRLEMADYDVNFMNYVFKRTLVESKGSG